MKTTLPIFTVGLFIALFQYASPLPNGSRDLAQLQFEAAKQCFNNQELFQAQRIAGLARSNAPDAAAPWLLIGHCFYLQGQDQAALFHYSMALKLDPHIGHLPPFLAELKRQGSVHPAALILSSSELSLLRKKIGQMIMVSVPGTQLSSQKKAMLKAGCVGGIILFNQNVQSKKQLAGYVRQLQANSPIPLFVAVDQEGGSVRRLTERQGFQRLPSLAALGETQDPNLAYRFGVLSGRQLKAVGANLNLAPVVDIDHGITGSIISKYRRSLGSDPQMVAGLAQQIIRGMRREKIIATAKHFPTQSVSAANPHEGISTTDVSLQELESRDLVPYRRLIQSGLLDAVMLSHVTYKSIDPYFPASLSPEVIQNLLRKELGYKGLVISDDLRMDAIKQHYLLEQSVVQAVNAGVDVLLVTDNLEQRVMNALVTAVEAGRISQTTINDSYQRIIDTKAKYGIVVSAKKNNPKATARLRGPQTIAPGSLEVVRR